MKVYPVPGRLVRDPRSRQPLPEAGRDVPEDSYWMRRVRDGDVTTEEPEATGTDETEHGA